MDTTTQIVLIIMILVLGSTLTLVGIMFVFILKDLRESISKVNSILENFAELSARVASGSLQIEEALISLRNSVEVVKEKAASPMGSILGVMGLIKTLMGNSEKEKKDE